MNKGLTFRTKTFSKYVELNITLHSLKFRDRIFRIRRNEEGLL